MDPREPSSAARGALALTQEIIDRCGPRLAGTAASREAAALLAERLRPVCDRVAVEHFPVHPGAFLGFLRVVAIAYLAGTALLVAGSALAAALCFTAGALVTIVEFVLYRELLDPFYPRRVGANVVATLEPAGEARRQLIFAGHHDSARIFNLLCHLPRLYRLRLVGAFVAVFGMPVVVWLGAGPAVVALDLALGLLFIAPMWFFLGKDGTPGAGDNLIASAMLVSIARALRSTGALRETRVILVSTDAEESGLRGARAFVQRHGAELRRLPTTLFNMDSVYRRDSIRFLASDLNGFVPLDRALAGRCVAIAATLGIPARTFRMYPGTGATDAAEFARAGVEATTLIAMPTDVESADLVYHTPRDVVASIEPAAVEACLAVALALAREVDGAERAADPVRESAPRARAGTPARGTRRGGRRAPGPGPRDARDARARRPGAAACRTRRSTPPLRR